MRIIDLDELDKLEETKKNYVNLQPEKSKRQRRQKRRKGRRGSQSVVKEMFHLVLAIVVVVLFMFLIVRFVGQRTQVNGSSMEATLSDQDNLIVDKISYRFTEPKRFDIVVFPYARTADSEEIYYIKRIIGLPGETVQILGGVIYINGERIEENYGNEMIEDAKLAANPIKLGEDEYFVLGDNRNHSSDSREIGPVKRSDMIGRAIVRIWPLEKIGVLR